MNEVKKPKKPLIFYYVLVLLILLPFNFLAMPWLMQRQVQQVDYGTFLDGGKQGIGPGRGTATDKPNPVYQ